MRFVPLPSRKTCAKSVVGVCASARMPLPGHSVPVVALTRRQPKPYLMSCVAPSLLKNEFRSTLTRHLRAHVRSSARSIRTTARSSGRGPAFRFMPPSGVRRKPVL